MGNRIKDVELAELQDNLGKKAYADLFKKTWMCCKNTKSHKRASGVYVNDTDEFIGNPCNNNSR